MGFRKYLSSLCTPALVFYVIAAFDVLSLIFTPKSTMDLLKNNRNIVTDIMIPDTLSMSALKVLYLGVMTTILQSLCAHGHSVLAWVALIVVPLVMMSIALAPLWASEMRKVAPIHH